MKQHLFFLAGFSLLLASCGHKEEPLINKSDYKNYSEFWFDKTISESGAAQASPLESEFDFDVLPPNHRGSHRFKIKNTGSNPLKFLIGPKSCKCTDIKIIDREIAPGDTGEIELHWKTVALAKQFNHTGSIYTNDPKQRLLTFTIKGRVAKEVAMTPGLFHFERVQPYSDQSEEEVLIFSEEWDNLEIENLTSSFGDDAKFEVSPISDAKKDEFKAKSGKLIKMTYKTPKKPGLINGNVSFKIVGPEKTIDHVIEVRGKVIRRLSLEETKLGTLTLDGVIHLDRVDRSQGKKEKFLITVNDKNKTLNLTDVITEPEYVKVELRPLNKQVQTHGVYILEISIPPGQKQANHNRKDSFGRLEIYFDHPRVAPYDLKLDFYIL